MQVIDNGRNTHNRSCVPYGEYASLALESYQFFGSAFYAMIQMIRKRWKKHEMHGCQVDVRFCLWYTLF